MSWNGLVAPHDDCIFRTAVWARETFGMATVAAAVAVAAAAIPTAPVRNLRRDGALLTITVPSIP
jgi:hypothetical protein